MNTTTEGMGLRGKDSGSKRQQSIFGNSATAQFWEIRQQALQAIKQAWMEAMEENITKNQKK
jgi:hypothetical protein